MYRFIDDIKINENEIIKAFLREAADEAKLAALSICNE